MYIRVRTSCTSCEKGTCDASHRTCIWFGRLIDCHVVNIDCVTLRAPLFTLLARQHSHIEHDASARTRIRWRLKNSAESCSGWYSVNDETKNIFPIYLFRCAVRMRTQYCTKSNRALFCCRDGATLFLLLHFCGLLLYFYLCYWCRVMIRARACVCTCGET